MSKSRCAHTIPKESDFVYIHGTPADGPSSEYWTTTDRMTFVSCTDATPPELRWKKYNLTPGRREGAGTEVLKIGTIYIKEAEARRCLSCPECFQRMVEHAGAKAGKTDLTMALRMAKARVRAKAGRAQK